MRIEERTIAAAGEDDMITASEVGWFAAKQPGLLRYLEDRLGQEPDAMAMALEMSWRVVNAFEMQRGLPLPRLHAAEIERAEEEVLRESRGELSLANGCAYRQPELCRWLEAVLASPALPLSTAALEQVALATAATISACDTAQHARAMESTEEPGALLL